jgi:ubiquinone/menaquinone biosynthesis C-methylase UbiE
VRHYLDNLPQQGHILELAGGTGIWTKALVNLGERVTVVDASPEMIAINQAHVASDKVDYIQADIFNWVSDQQYDMIYFSFWLSHVPPDRLAGFLSNVASMLKPSGTLFILDSLHIPEATAKDQPLPEQGYIMTRKLNDGTEYQIVKVFYDLDQLKSALSDAGIDAQVHRTDSFFLYAHGHKRA